MSFNNTSQLFTSQTQLDLGQDGTTTPGEWAHNTTAYTPIDSMTPITTNPSRKRSRDETTFAADGENSYFSFPSVADVTTPAPIPEEPIYGEGMSLISPTTGRPVTTAESQTGTWYEEQEARKKLEAEVAADQEQRIRPRLPTSRKSIRLSQSSIRAILEPSALVTNGGAPASPPKSTSDRPEVDEATLALGIGWTKLSSEDSDLQAAARGWARYIENHFRQIHNVEVLLKSRSLNAYLIGSQEGFYLFSDDLLEGKLVGRTWDICLQNLKASPMAFEGDEVLRAERTPGPDADGGKRETTQSWAGNDRSNHRMEATTADAHGMELD